MKYYTRASAAGPNHQILPGLRAISELEATQIALGWHYSYPMGCLTCGPPKHSLQSPTRLCDNQEASDCTICGGIGTFTIIQPCNDEDCEVKHVPF